MPAGELDASRRVKAFLTRGREGLDAVPPQIRALEPGFHNVKPNGRDWHVAVVDTEDGLLRVVLDATDSESRVNHFGWTLLALWAGCAVVTAWIARGVARIAVGPIVEAAKSIARWTPEAQPQSGDTPDEAATLMETFNRYRDSVDDTVVREREFAANLDHEIRTPLTTIRTDAELIAIEGPLAPPQQRRLERITSSVDEIIGTTESTLSSSARRAAPPRARRPA